MSETSVLDKLLATAEAGIPEPVLTFSVPAAIFNEAFGKALTQALSVTPEFQAWARTQVARFVKELAPQSEHFQSIRDEVAKHLERYPAIGSDPAMQDAIASAILGTMVKTVR